MDSGRGPARLALAAIIVVAAMMPIERAVPDATAKPGAQSEIGVTSTEIRIAVVADVDNPIAPGVFQGVVDGVNGFARYVNARGGLAGRRVVVDFLDSKLNASQSRSSMISACANDFVVVSAALFLNNVDDVESCPDASGLATGLPDLSVVYTSVAQQCSKTTYAVRPPVLVCSTKDQHPQTYQSEVGRGYWYQGRFGNALHGILIDSADVKSTRDAQFVLHGGIFDPQVGIGLDAEFPLSGSVLQSGYTPLVQAINQHHSNVALCANPAPYTINLRKEAQLQGVTGVKVWDCYNTCYDPSFLTRGGTDVEGQYVAIANLPFSETTANAMQANFIRFTGRDKANVYSEPAFSTGILLRDAVHTVVARWGSDALTRAHLFAALNDVHEFDADGIIAATPDLAAKQVSPCYILLQVRHGEFVRVHPTRPGTYDCRRRNVIRRKLDLLQG
jgi:hypothetical protein